MLARIPRRRFDSMSSSDARRPPSSFVPAPPYSHVSTYRSAQLEMQVHSPSVKVMRREDQDDTGPLPVFGDHDQVRGKVVLDPSCSSSGRLAISIEGAFMYTSPESEAGSTSGRKRKHVFLSSSATFSVGSEGGSPRSAFREAFAASVRRRPSVSSFPSTSASADRSYPFSFDLPRSCRSGEELPPSFSSSTPVEVPPRGRGFAENYEVAYTVIASWEASSGHEKSSSLEVPILLHPDTDFQSLDALSLEPDSWLEMPLRSDRPIPFRCAVTLPSSVTFSRESSIPYFVVFTTTPRSLSLAREIAADATISVSLLHQITINEPPSLLPTPPHTPTGSSDESDAPRGGKLLKRVVKNTPPIVSRSPSLNTLDGSPVFKDKPLPRLPTQMTFSESRTLQSSMCIGFPKRPRNRCDSQSHPPLDSYNTLPDGLHKSKIQLSTSMLPSVDWAGVSVKYYLDVSVLIGQDDLRARIPIKIL